MYWCYAACHILKSSDTFVCVLFALLLFSSVDFIPLFISFIVVFVISTQVILFYFCSLLYLESARLAVVLCYHATPLHSKPPAVSPSAPLRLFVVDSLESMSSHKFSSSTLLSHSLLCLIFAVVVCFMRVCCVYNFILGIIDFDY